VIPEVAAQMPFPRLSLIVIENDEVRAVDLGFCRPEQLTTNEPGIVKPLVKKTSSIWTEGGTMVTVWNEAEAVVFPFMVKEQLGKLRPANEISAGNTIDITLPFAIEALGVIARE